jgi:hypothetical protein
VSHLPAMGQVRHGAGLAQHAAIGQLLHAGRQQLAPAAGSLSSTATQGYVGHAAEGGWLDTGAGACAAGRGFSAPWEGSPPVAARVAWPQKISAAVTGNTMMRTSAEVDN